MKRSCKNCIIMLLALILSVFTAELDCARWVLADGTTRQCCCLDLPFSILDLQRESLAPPASGAAVAPSDSTRTVGEVPYPAGLTGTPGFSAPVLHVALLAGVAEFRVPLPTEVIARSRESRGPPLSRPTPDVPSLRAPPAA